MTTPQLVQAILIALIGAWAAWFAFRRLFPKTYRQLLSRLLAAFDRAGAPGWLRVVARRAQPTGTSGGSCADGCSSCGGCAAASAGPATETQPLVFKPRLPRG